mgnify:FL=1
MSFLQEKFPHILLISYLALFVWLGLEPYSRAVWFAENLPILAIVIVLLVLYFRGVRLSNTSYALMSILIFWNTVGGHFTFARVPFDWFNDLFGFERNMYDRVGHFGVGFYAYAILELLDRYEIVRKRAVAYLFSFFAIAFIALSYEVLEWAVAVTYGGDVGPAFLGIQGDEWDAQKDVLLNMVGATLALSLYFTVNVWHSHRQERRVL